MPLDGGRNPAVPSEVSRPSVSAPIDRNHHRANLERRFQRKATDFDPKTFRRMSVVLANGFARMLASSRAI